MRHFVLTFWACFCLAGASFEPFRPEIPIAFEENRGQSRGPFPYLVTHHGAGLSCDGLFWPGDPKWLDPRPVRVRFVHAPSGCAGTLEDADPAWVHYYGAGEPILWQQRYRTLRFANGFEYRSVPEGVLASWVFRDVAALRAFRLEWAPDTRVWVSDANRIETRAGEWRVTSTPAVVMTASTDGVVTFDAPGASGPVALSLLLPLKPVMPSVSTGAFDSDGNWYTASTTAGYADYEGSPIICYTTGTAPPCGDTVIAKFDAALRLQYLVYLRGESYDQTTSLAVDSGGNVYAGGYTYSRDFHVTPGVIQSNHAGPNPAAIARFPASGDSFLTKIHGPTGGVIYSTFLGAEDLDGASLVDVDEQGRTYLRVLSASTAFPSWGEPLVDPIQCGTTSPFGSKRWCSFLVSLDENAASVRYSKPGPVGLPEGRGSALWFFAAGELRRVNSDGEVVARVAAPPDLRGFGVDADGRVWVSAPGFFGHSEGDTLVQVSSDLPPARQIRASSDGTFWLVTFDPEVLQVSQTGEVLARFPLPDVNAEVRTGPGGQVMLTSGHILRP